MKPLSICIDTEDWDIEELQTFLREIMQKGMLVHSWSDVFESRQMYQETLKELSNTWFTTYAVGMGDTYEISYEEWEQLDKLFVDYCNWESEC